jgi:saccharopine dehydrogenase-like NADP-dependent oxidoreductase
MVDMKEQIAAALRSNQLTAKEITENIGENYKTVFGHLTQMKALKLIELLDDKTYVLTDLGMIEFTDEPLPKPKKVKLADVTEKFQPMPTQVESFETRITPINEKTVEEINQTVNYDATTPSHYQGKTIQVFDVLNEFLTIEANQGFYVGNVIKYVVRFKGKNGKEDLLKAREYLNKLIDSL